jgi:DNA-binding protein H-NS
MNNLFDHLNISFYYLLGCSPPVPFLNLSGNKIVMNEFLEMLTHARRFKAAVKDLSIEELRDVAVKLEKIISDREAMAEEENKANAERNAKIEEIRKQMEAIGLSVDDLGGVAVKAVQKKRAPRPPKYQIEVNGEMVQWTGQGRMPTVFKQQLDKGHSMDEFLI